MTAGYERLDRAGVREIRFQNTRRAASCDRGCGSPVAAIRRSTVHSIGDTATSLDLHRRQLHWSVRSLPSVGRAFRPRNSGRRRAARRPGKSHDQAHHRRQGDRRSGRIHAAAGLRGRRRRDSALLFPRAAVDRRQLPHVPGRAGRLAEAGRVLRLGRARLPSRPERRAAGRQHPHADGAQGARRRDGIPADQSSARLPDLRSGRRMRPAGSGDGLRRRHQPLSRRTSARSRTNISARWSRPR